MTTQTIPRNHTRKLSDLKARTTKADLHCLDNGFSAEPVDPEHAWSMVERHSARVTLHGADYAGRTVTIRVHSNLFYCLTLEDA